MNNQTENPSIPTTVYTHQIGNTAVAVRSFYAGKETLQDILKRLIMREYERQTTRPIH